MLPTLEGVIARRTLLNFWVDPEVLRPLVPAPLELDLRDGMGVAGICLIRLEHLRPRHTPSAVGLSSENMAHRVAIKYPSDEGMEPGVFIWRRETDRALVSALGGRAFPGVHGRADFDISEQGQQIHYRVRSKDDRADVDLTVREVDEWNDSRLFPAFDDVRTFFARGDAGFSCTLDGHHMEGMRLETLEWNMVPLEVDTVRSTFYDDSDRFPPGSIGLDGAVLMRGVPHRRHELSSIPELAGVDS
jgi:uncharacterized protein YqjF (DUF2071 family)